MITMGVMCVMCAVSAVSAAMIFVLGMLSLFTVFVVTAVLVARTVGLLPTKAVVTCRVAEVTVVAVSRISVRRLVMALAALGRR
ncbi:hypothetical protein [Streptomyces sp. DSM 40750]|uniref:hypothetical protein n=1 Tax=Streptomyces sp. DSM 40750 TaxID=2801030 RepID=UPI0027D46FEB|nr:hypothetical protein [Streptomyces sp. DSM 40750]